MKLFHTRIGHTLNIHDAAALETVRKQIVPDGPAAHYQDGTSEWVCDEVVCDPTQEGSAQYQWDKNGNRVKHARVRYVKNSQGKVTRKVESVVYKSL